jgi:hypothetical protein
MITVWEIFIISGSIIRTWRFWAERNTTNKT